MMKRIAILLAVGLPAFFAAPKAEAHFKLTQPVDALKTDETGDPMAGSQKSSPCGSGTASKLATQVKAGSKLHVKLTETIAHGGHYRIALSPKKADFVDPKAVVTGGNCVSAPITEPPSGVILADGLFKHADEDFGSGKEWETDVTIPNETCDNCLLQVIEFMTPHSPGCFYYHCANIQVVDANATIEGDGVVPFDPTTPASSSGETSSSSGETSSSGATSSGASSTGGQKAPESSSSGCNVASDTAPSYITMGIAGVFVMASLRRRRRLHDRRAR